MQILHYQVYDSVPQEMIRRYLEAKRVPRAFICAIQEIYLEVGTCVRTEDTRYFLGEVGVHQGSVHYFF